MGAPVDPARPAAVATAPPPPVPVSVPALPAVRGMDGERAIARVLRAGAILAGACFAAAIVLERVPALQHDAQLLREAGATLLVVTPVARLVVAGVALGIRGEYRYSTCAGLILVLLVAAAGLGFAR